MDYAKSVLFRPGCWGSSKTKCCGAALRLQDCHMGWEVLGLGFPLPPSFPPSQPISQHAQPPSSSNLKPLFPLFPVPKREMPSAAPVPRCADGTSLGCGRAAWNDRPHPPPCWTLLRGGGPSSHRWVVVIMTSRGWWSANSWGGLKAFRKDVSLSLCYFQAQKRLCVFTGGGTVCFCCLWWIVQGFMQTGFPTFLLSSPYALDGGSLTGWDVFKLGNRY